MGSLREVVVDLPSDSWEELPEDVTCEMVTQMTDIDKVDKYSKSSPWFFQVSKWCTRELTSKRPIRVPIENISHLSKLETVGDNIEIDVDFDNVHLLHRLPKLTQANICFRMTLDDLESR